MKDNHTWVICAYGKSDYLEACIMSQVMQKKYCPRWKKLVMS